MRTFGRVITVLVSVWLFCKETKKNNKRWNSNQIRAFFCLSGAMTDQKLEQDSGKCFRIFFPHPKSIYKDV